MSFDTDLGRWRLEAPEPFLECLVAAAPPYTPFLALVESAKGVEE